jgi:hypothetical protein
VKHPLSHRFLSLALALLVLAASIGLPVLRRTCRVSGRSTAHIAWSPVNTACALGQKGNQLKQTRHRLESSCYAYSLHLHQLSAPAYTPVVVKLPAALVWLALPAATPFIPPTSLTYVGGAVHAGWFTSKSPPPPPSGRILLVQIGKWVV